jgi:hypothetical protein
MSVPSTVHCVHCLSVPHSVQSVHCLLVPHSVHSVHRLSVPHTPYADRHHTAHYPVAVTLLASVSATVVTNVTYNFQ